MTLNWETFKTASGLSNTSLAYIDDEGSEIPIGSDCEFQEALRLAKLNKNRMKFILYEDKVKPSEKINLGFGQTQQSVINQSEKFLEGFKKNFKNTVTHTSMKDSTCCCHGDVPPEWFSHHMKKFEKELLHELKSHIHDVVQSAFEKEKKSSFAKSEISELFNEKIENSFSPIGTQSKKKKKLSEKDSTDPTDQREIKLPKKLEKLHATKSERLEKLDNKTRVLLEEKKRLLERKRHSKSKLDKNSLVANEKKKKSAFFRPNDVYIFLPPGSKFSVSLNVINDGKVRWTAPRLQCFEMSGLSLKEDKISLPRLLPGESCSVTLKGHVSQSAGLHYVKCKVVDGSECFGPEFTCFARVEASDKSLIDSSLFKESEDKEVSQHLNEETLIDFEKDIISSSQRKIEENINEIERRLHDIDLLRPSTSTESNLKMNFGKKSNNKTNDCDLMLMCDGNEKSWKDRLAQEDLLFGTEPDPTENVKMEIDKGNDKKEEGKVKNSEKDSELESCSDSEMTLSFKFEDDDDNFIFVPSKSPSPAESANEDKNFQIIDLKEKSPVENNEIDRQQMKHGDKETIQKDEEKVTERFPQVQLSPTRSRRSPFGEEISKPKKMKSKSTEYRFTAANLTQPIFTQIPEGIFEKKTTGFSSGQSSEEVFSSQPSKFSFTGEKEKGRARPEKAAEGGPQKFTFTGAKGAKPKDVFRRRVPRTDAVGKVIFAVNSNGYCVPVENLFENERKRGGTDKRNERFNDSTSTANNFPNALMNGASNVASFAFNTAKSVISNFQSAFVTEGKTEFGKPAYEDNVKVSMDAMFKLYDMGFSDFQINRKLLILHDNDLNKVIEELVRLHKNSTTEPH